MRYDISPVAQKCARMRTNAHSQALPYPTLPYLA